VDTHHRKPPTGPPPSAGVLTRYVRAYAREAGVSEGRVRGWIAYMILAGALERSPGIADGHRFTIKGGIALELRLREHARATKDIDVVLHDRDADLARAFERAVFHEGAAEYEGFRFRRKSEPLVLDNGTVSMELAVTYLGNAWTSITVDVARAEPGESEVDRVPAVQLTEAFGVTGPTDIPCLPLRFHIAQKLHGMTLPPRPGARNDRFKDLVDLLLLEPLVTDLVSLRAACALVFETRGTHAWPPPLDVPEHWVAPFAAMAQEIELPVTDASDAMTRVRQLVERIQTV
jgi:Nucleotidyl transferase AbiEii toxin, Type IV TA system